MRTPPSVPFGRRVTSGLFAVLLALTAATSSRAQDDPAVALDALTSITDAPGVQDRAWRDRLRAAYRRDWASPATVAAVQQVDNAALRTWHEATVLVNFYAAATVVDDQAIVLAELRRRGLATERDSLDQFRSLVHARRFDAAAALQRAYPVEGMEVLPRLTPLAGDAQGEPTVMQVDPQTRRMQRRVIDLSQGVKIVAIVHPGCGFSRRALEAIAADTELKSVFDEHAHFVAPPSGRIEFDRFRDWNRGHAGVPIELAYHVDEWPLPAMSSTPVFHFFRAGELVESVTGWPQEGSAAALLAAARRVGVRQESEE